MEIKVMAERPIKKRNTSSPKGIVSCISLEYLQSSSSPYLTKQSKLAYKSFGEAVKIRKRSKNQTQHPKSISDLSLNNIPSCALPKIDEKGNVKNKLLYFKDKLRRQLQKAESENTCDEQYFNLYNDLFEELIDYLAPFTEVLRKLKDGIVTYNKTEVSNDLDEKIHGFEVMKLEKTVDYLNKEKEIMVKKLNKLLDELEKYKKENAEISKKVVPQIDKFLDYDRVIENLLKQSNTIHCQNMKIKELTQGNIKLEKIIEKLRSSNADIDMVFEQVNKEAHPDFLMIVN